MHWGKGESCRPWILMAMFLLSSLSSTSSSSIRTSLDRRPRAGICDKANYGKGPLNLTSSTYSLGSTYEIERAWIYHCVHYFTSFHWYRIRSKDDYNINLGDISVDSDSRFEPYPWGEGGRVRYLHKRHDNQTIVVPRTKTEDDGMYVFIVGNGTHWIKGKFRLIVDCRDTGPTISIAEQHVQPVALGANKTLTCAVSPPKCPGGFYEVNVFWAWQNFQPRLSPMLKNSTFNDSVSVVCDGNSPYLGRKCVVLIDHVEDRLYHGEFVCLTNTGNDVNQTVRLVPIRHDFKTWWPYILATASALALMGLVLGVLWGYRHSIKFWCPIQPHRGRFEADVVIVHGEDHEQVVKNYLLPGVRALGYELLEVDSTPGRLGLQDNLKAVDKAYSVLLTFSAREMAEEGDVDYLIEYVFKTKTRSTALFIPCPNCSVATPSATQQSVVRGRSVLGQQASTKIAGAKELESFKTLDLPAGFLSTTSSEAGSWSDGPEVERFWKDLQKHLPRRSGESSRQNMSPGFPESCDVDAGERQPILKSEAGSAGRSSVRPTAQFGTFGALDVRAGEIV